MELKNFQSFVDQVSKEETDQYYFTIKYYEKKGWPIKIPPAILIKAAELYAEYRAEQARKIQKELIFKEGSEAQMKKDNEVYSYNECGDKDYSHPFGELVENPYLKENNK